MPPRQNPASIVFRSLVVVLLIGLGVGVAYWLFSTSPVPPSSVRPEIRRTVDVVEVSPVPVLRPWIGYGLSSAEVSEDVPAEVSSIVTMLPPGIKAGNRVSKGDLLAKLDEGDFRRQHEIAERSINEIAARFDQHFSRSLPHIFNGRSGCQHDPVRFHVLKNTDFEQRTPFNTRFDENNI